jgi:hypothetical protein
MTQLLRLLQAVGLNFVPLGGVFFGGWALSTAFFLYWAENLLSGLGMGLRLGLHERWTGTRGHRRLHLREATEGAKPKYGAPGSYRREFVSTSLIFSLVHGVFVCLFVFLLFDRKVSLEEAMGGVVAVAVLELIVLAWDLPRLRRWSFAEMKAQAQKRLGRVVVVHMALLFGMGLAALTNRQESFFYVFAGLKLLTDLGSVLPQLDSKSEKPPGCVAWIGKVFPKKSEHAKGGPKDETFEDYWRRTTREEKAREEADEEVVAPRER